MGIKYDFCGWATKNNVKCSDGRTIRQDAFADDDGKKVPLVWQHQHNSLENVLGHAILENRADGVYAYCKLNDTYMGQNAKELIKHGDIQSLSIYANQLKQNKGDVVHGVIRELSLVLAGANPEAIIENLALEHSIDSENTEALIFAEEPIELMHSDNEVNDDEEFEEENEDMEHSDMLDIDEVLDTMDEDQLTVVDYLIDQAIGGEEIEHSDFTTLDELYHACGGSGDDEKKKRSLEHSKDMTIADVIESMTPEQKDVMYYLISKALEDTSVKHSDEEELSMKTNVFEGEDMYENNALSHDAMETIMEDAKESYGSLKKSVLAHSGDYGIDNIEYLFPDYKAMQTPPDFIKRDDDWVSKVMNGVHHTPFSRIKSIHADITEDDARAKGYVKGNLKLEEVFGLLKRVTDPQTVYKKQKLDRDDIIDITDFNVVAWLKTEMRMMLNEELARAILVGDGRSSVSRDKINPEHIRPIWGDNELYTINSVVTFAAAATADQKADQFITACIKARKNYKGSGNPVMFTSEDMLTDMLLLKDGIGHRLYKSKAELATALMVADIIAVPVFEGLYRTVSGVNQYLGAVIVNLNDYNVGADKGGSINMFEDFDIDYNQEKYLIETRCSGALTKPYSAITVETKTAAAQG